MWYGIFGNEALGLTLLVWYVLYCMMVTSVQSLRLARLGNGTLTNHTIVTTGMVPV